MTADDPLAHLDFEPEEQPEVAPNIVRRMALFDVALNAKEIAEAVGLPPISEEQAVAERDASLVRLTRVNRLDPAITDHTEFMAAVFVKIQREAYRAAHGGDDMPDEAWQSSYDHLQHMLNTTCMSLVSVLVELGALHLDPQWQQPSEQEHKG